MRGGNWFSAALIAAIALAWVAIAVRRRRMFRAAGLKLGVEHLTFDSRSLGGELRGLHVHALHTGGGRFSSASFSVDVACNPCALVLSLRPQSAKEVRDAERSEAVDLTTGDDAFDDTWIVEGAPAEPALRVLADAALRARLTALARVDGASVEIGDGKVTVSQTTTDFAGGALITERVELAVALTEAIIEQSRALAPAAASPEIAWLLALQGKRSAASMRANAAASHAAFLVVLLLLAGDTGLGRVASALLVAAMAALDAGVFLQLRKIRRTAPDVALGPVFMAWVAVTWAAVAALVWRSL